MASPSLDVQRIVAQHLAVVADIMSTDGTDLSSQARRDLVALRHAITGRPVTTEYRRIGYRLLADADTIRRITDYSDNVAQRDYHLTDGKVRDRVFDRLAVYVARHYDPERVAELLATPRWQYGITRLITDQVGRRAASGGGSMARLPEDYERTVGTLYSPWLDAFGLTAPTIGNTARATGMAPGIPERDAPSLARHTVWARALRGTDDTDLVLQALDHVYITSRGTWSVPWRTVADGTDLTPRTARERVQRALRVLRPTDRPTTTADRPTTTPTDRPRRPTDADRWRNAANAKRDQLDVARSRGTLPVAGTWHDGIAPPQRATVCCPAHGNVVRANALRAVIGRPPITTARCSG